MALWNICAMSTNKQKTLSTSKTHQCVSSLTNKHLTVVITIHLSERPVITYKIAINAYEKIHFTLAACNTRNLFYVMISVGLSVRLSVC